MKFPINTEATYLNSNDLGWAKYNTSLTNESLIAPFDGFAFIAINPNSISPPLIRDMNGLPMKALFIEPIGIIDDLYGTSLCLFPQPTGVLFEFPNLMFDEIEDEIIRTLIGNRASITLGVADTQVEERQVGLTGHTRIDIPMPGRVDREVVERIKEVWTGGQFTGIYIREGQSLLNLNRERPNTEISLGVYHIENRRNSNPFLSGIFWFNSSSFFQRCIDARIILPPPRGFIIRGNAESFFLQPFTIVYTRPNIAWNRNSVILKGGLQNVEIFFPVNNISDINQSYYLVIIPSLIFLKCRDTEFDANRDRIIEGRSANSLSIFTWCLKENEELSGSSEPCNNTIQSNSFVVNWNDLSSDFPTDSLSPLSKRVQIKSGDSSFFIEVFRDPFENLNKLLRDYSRNEENLNAYLVSSVVDHSIDPNLSTYSKKDLLILLNLIINDLSNGVRRLSEHLNTGPGSLYYEINQAFGDYKDELEQIIESITEVLDSNNFNSIFKINPTQYRYNIWLRSIVASKSSYLGIDAMSRVYRDFLSTSNTKRISINDISRILEREGLDFGSIEDLTEGVFELIKILSHGRREIIRTFLQSRNARPLLRHISVDSGNRRLSVREDLINSLSETFKLTVSAFVNFVNVGEELSESNPGLSSEEKLLRVGSAFMLGLTSSFRLLASNLETLDTPRRLIERFTSPSIGIRRYYGGLTFFTLIEVVDTWYSMADAFRLRSRYRFRDRNMQHYANMMIVGNGIQFFGQGGTTISRGLQMLNASSATSAVLGVLEGVALGLSRFSLLGALITGVGGILAHTQATRDPRYFFLRHCIFGQDYYDGSTPQEWIGNLSRQTSEALSLIYPQEGAIRYSSHRRWMIETNFFTLSYAPDFFISISCNGQMLFSEYVRVSVVREDGTLAGEARLNRDIGTDPLAYGITINHEHLVSRIQILFPESINSVINSIRAAASYPPELNAELIITFMGEGMDLLENNFTYQYPYTTRFKYLTTVEAPQE